MRRQSKSQQYWPLQAASRPIRNPLYTYLACFIAAIDAKRLYVTSGRTGNDLNPLKVACQYHDITANGTRLKRMPITIWISQGFKVYALSYRKVDSFHTSNRKCAFAAIQSARNNLMRGDCHLCRSMSQTVVVEIKSMDRKFLRLISTVFCQSSVPA